MQGDSQTEGKTEGKGTGSQTPSKVYKSWLRDSWTIEEELGIKPEPFHLSHCRPNNPIPPLPVLAEPARLGD